MVYVRKPGQIILDGGNEARAGKEYKARDSKLHANGNPTGNASALSIHASDTAPRRSTHTHSGTGERNRNRSINRVRGSAANDECAHAHPYGDDGGSADGYDCCPGQSHLWQHLHCHRDDQRARL